MRRCLPGQPRPIRHGPSRSIVPGPLRSAHVGKSSAKSSRVVRFETLAAPSDSRPPKCIPHPRRVSNCDVLLNHREEPADVDMWDWRHVLNCAVCASTPSKVDLGLVRAPSAYLGTVRHEGGTPTFRGREVGRDRASPGVVMMCVLPPAQHAGGHLDRCRSLRIGSTSLVQMSGEAYEEVAV